MSKMIRLVPLLGLIVWCAGCASTITNLTPSKQTRSATGMYPVEMAWNTRQQTLRPTTLQPYVVVEFQSFPMRPTLGMSNRWETVVAIPGGRNSVNYHFRVDYEYNQFGRPQRSSKLSPGYRLEILDK
ncbi:MAG: hypothetical protein HZA90_04800 [Verrucomicrobia bacterium]|nr:hypothetical protein [Verrucomicrobiota bacterium]